MSQNEKKFARASIYHQLSSGFGGNSNYLQLVLEISVREMEQDQDIPFNAVTPPKSIEWIA